LGAQCFSVQSPTASKCKKALRTRSRSAVMARARLQKFRLDQAIALSLADLA